MMASESRLGAHGGLPKLLRVHFTKTFVALGLHTVFRTVAVGVDKVLALGVVVAVFLDFSLFAAIERRHGDVEVAVLDDLREVAVEQGHDKGGYVLTVDIGIGHDDDLVVT